MVRNIVEYLRLRCFAMSLAKFKVLFVLLMSFTTQYVKFPIHHTDNNI